MTVQHSTAVRNARLDAIEATIGTSPILRIRSGAKPANCAASRSGTILASLTLPSDWLGDASSGQKLKAGTWEDLSADASGTAGHYEIMDSGGTTCHEQGTITANGGGGDMELDNTVLAAGQQFTVTAYGLTEGNA
jgi:hypothetical protein